MDPVDLLPYDSTRSFELCRFVTLPAAGGAFGERRSFTSCRLLLFQGLLFRRHRPFHLRQFALCLICLLAGEHRVIFNKFFSLLH